jgi:hypothetical protein
MAAGFSISVISGGENIAGHGGVPQPRRGILLALCSWKQLWPMTSLFSVNNVMSSILQYGIS